jgi:tetratricopeptide (TPR) repeat protein
MSGSFTPRWCLAVALLSIFAVPLRADDTRPDKERAEARKLQDRAEALQKMGKRAEADKLFRQAIERFTKLVRDYPAVPAYRHDLAIASIHLGRLSLGVGKPAEAERQFRQAIALFEQLLKADTPDRAAGNSRGLAAALTELGRALQAGGKAADAMKALQRARTIQEKLVKDHPKEAAYRKELAQTLTALGKALAAQGKKKEAEEVQKQARALNEKK